LIEDDPVSALALQSRLETWGYTVDVASTASEARARLGPDHALLLIDRHLPDAESPQLLAELRAHGLRVPALAISAELEPETQDALISAGFGAALCKPLRADQLLAALLALGCAPPTWGRTGNHTVNMTDAATADLQQRLRDLLRAELPGFRLLLEQHAARPYAPAHALDSGLHRMLGAAAIAGAVSLTAGIEAVRESLRHPAPLAEQQEAVMRLLAVVETLTGSEVGGDGARP
jgi:CheY-like chemotaxis protein